MASGRERWQWQALIRQGRYALKDVDRVANARFHAFMQAVEEERGSLDGITARELFERMDG